MSNRRKIDLAKLAQALGRQLNREQLAEQHRTAILRSVRAMEDRPGHVPQRLLDDLADIAGRHAAEENADRVIAAQSTRGDPPAARTARKPAET